MLKSTITVLVAAFALSPAALADGVKKVTLTHQYDAALLSSDEGASTLLTELERAAERTCTSRVPAYGGQFIDETCADSLFRAAVKQIHAAESADGVTFAPAFERVALTQLASAD